MSQTTVSIQVKVDHDGLSEYHQTLSLLVRALEIEGVEVISVDKATVPFKPCGHAGNCRCFHRGGSIEPRITRSTD